MPKKYEFDALIMKHPDLNAAFIEFPYDVKKEFGKGRVKVKALIDGIPYQGSLVKMGGECHWLGITQEIRKKTGRNPGDMVHITIEEDIEERTVNIPEDLYDSLNADKQVLEAFNKLSFTHRKEYVRWVTESKKRRNPEEQDCESYRKVKDKNQY